MRKRTVKILKIIAVILVVLESDLRCRCRRFGSKTSPGLCSIRNGRPAYGTGRYYSTGGSGY